MDSFVTDTQALVKFMMGKKVINDKAHQAFLVLDIFIEKERLKKKVSAA